MGERLAQLGVELAAGDDHAGDRIADVAGDLVEQEGGRLEVDPGDRGQRPPLAPVERERVGRGDRALDRDRRQRLAPGKVEVDGSGPGLAARRRQRPAGDRAEVEQPVVVGFVGPDFAEPAHRFAVELDLVDRLPGADPAQLRRPVGGEDDQRQRRLVGLADGGVVVGGGACRRCRAAPPARRSPAPRRARRTRPSARRAITVTSIPGCPPERDRERRRARAGGDDRAPQPAACELLGEGRGECGVGVGRVHVGIARLKAVSRQRLLVDLDAEARAGRRVQRSPSRSSHSTAAMVAAKRRWVARPWASSPLAGQGVPATAWAARAPDGDPDRSVEGAGDVGRQCLRRSRSAGSRPPTLESLIPVSAKAPRSPRPRRVLDGDDALVAGERDRRPLAPARRLLHRSPPAARPARSSSGSSSREHRVRRLEDPRPRWRRPGSAPRLRAPPAPPAPGRRPRRRRASA